MQLYTANSYSDLSRKGANILSAQVILHPGSVLGLATGSTPVGIYRQLVEWYRKGDLDFSKVHTVNLDEYVGLSPTDPQSYRYFMNENLFDHINIETNNTHVPDGLAAPEDACLRYETIVRELGGIDMQLLGIGHNGHIGFNEPGSSFEKRIHTISLTQSTIEANSRYFPEPEKMPKFAITMGIASIMQARRILVVVSGASKAAIVRQAFQGPITPEVPASILQLHNNVTLVGDTEALSLLDPDKFRS
jgi:glucosamine-6-phosphate deaminase